MTVIAIATILMALAGGSFHAVVQSNRTLSEMNSLTSAMKVARAEALKRGTPVSLCASSNGSTCSGLADWRNGWITFIDVNGNAALDTGDGLFKVQRALPGTDTMTASGGTSAMAFNRDGFPLNLSAQVVWTIKTQPENTAYTRCLLVNQVGRLLEVNRNGSTCS